MLSYPIRITPDTVGYMATCRDLSEFVGAGDTVEDTLQNAVEGLETTLGIYLDERRLVPQPSAPQPGEQSVAVPALTTAKVFLSNALLEAGWAKADLARALRCHPTQVERLLDVNHQSRLDRLEAALAALGKRLRVEVSTAA